MPDGLTLYICFLGNFSAVKPLTECQQPVKYRSRCSLGFHPRHHLKAGKLTQLSVFLKLSYTLGCNFVSLSSVHHSDVSFNTHFSSPVEFLSFLYLVQSPLGYMQRSLSPAGLRRLFPEMPLAGIWDLGRVPIIPQTNKCVLLCLDSLYKQYVLCWTPAFHLGSWYFETCSAEGAYMTNPQWKPWALRV